MNHVEREILSALIDGELSGEEQRFVNEHLRQCDACRDALEEFAHVHGMVENLPPLVAPESFVAAAMTTHVTRSGAWVPARIGWLWARASRALSSLFR